MLRHTIRSSRLFCNAACSCQTLVNKTNAGKCIRTFQETSIRTNCKNYSVDNNTPSTVGSRLSGGDSEKKQQENEPSEDVSSRTSCCKANIDDPECDEHHLNPVFKTMVPDYTQNVKMVEMVPGKGPPPEPPLDCCMSGCPSCLWINYAEELKDYYHDGDERALSAIEKIDNVSLRTFIKLELGYL